MHARENGRSSRACVKFLRFFRRGWPSCSATDFYGSHKTMRSAYINISRLELVNLLVPSSPLVHMLAICSCNIFFFLHKSSVLQLSRNLKMLLLHLLSARTRLFLCFLIWISIPPLFKNISSVDQHSAESLLTRLITQCGINNTLLRCLLFQVRLSILQDWCEKPPVSDAEATKKSIFERRGLLEINVFHN